MTASDDNPVDDEQADGRMTRSAGLVGLLTLASRVLGLIRDAVVAALFRQQGTDAFFVAFTVPNVLRRLLAEGSLTVAFIPVYTAHRARYGEEQARAMVRAALGLALLALIAATAIGVFAAPLVVRAFAYGLTRHPETLSLATLLTRLVFPYLIPVGLTALAMGVLNSRQHFAAPAAAPAVLNIGIIGTVLVGHGWLVARGWPPSISLAVGALVGGGAQVLLQLAPLGRHQSLVLPKLDLAHPAVREVTRLMAPSVFALAVYQIYVMLARQFASFLPEGSISEIYYAQRLIEFPIGIFAVALATVVMPELSQQASAGDLERVKRTFRFSLRMTAFVLLPATAGLIAVAVPLCAVVFQRGPFDHQMARDTARTLVGFCCGLLAAGGVRQTVQVFYALHDTRTPVKVSAVCLAVFTAAAWVLHRPLGTFGLALAVSLATTVNLMILVVLLRRRLGPLGLGPVVTSAALAALCAAGCGLGAWGICRVGDWTFGGARAFNYAVLLAAVTAGVVIYAALCRLLRVAELTSLLHAVRSGAARDHDTDQEDPRQ